MSTVIRRVVAALATSLAVAGVSLVGVPAHASPVPAAETCVPNPFPVGPKQICVPIVPTPPGGPTPPGETCLPAPLNAICIPTTIPTLPIPLPGGGTGTGISTATPTSFPNTATAEVVTIADPFTGLYEAVGGADIQLVGPGTGTDVINGTNVTFNDSANTISVTFDLNDSLGLPAGPGAYLLEISPADGATLPLPLPVGAVDSVAVTVTADPPTPTATVSVAPGATTAASITTSSVPFASGDAVSFTDSSKAAVSGLTLTNPVFSASAITGTVGADSTVAAGSYNLLVTDTAGQTGTCAGCVTVAAGPNAVTGLTATPTTGTTATLGWTAPTTGPTVTTYSFVISKTATATTSDSGVKVTQTTPTSPSASVTGLTAGTKYFVTVTPHHDTLAGTATGTSMLTPYATTLTLSDSPAKPVGAESVTFTGQLTRTIGKTPTPLGGKTVGLFVKYAGSTHSTKLSTFTTAADGTYKYSFVPQKGGVYVAAFLGDAASGTTPGDSYALSPTITQVVTPTVTISGSDKAHGSSFTVKVKGRVSPNEAGKKVTVYRTVKGSPEKLGSAKLDSSGRYKVVKKHQKAGTYKLQAKIKAHSGLAAASSSKFTVKAR